MFPLGSIIPGLGPISRFFADILNFFNSFTHNWTLSVILLTVAFRIVVLPLSFKQTKSMIAMQKVQPQLKEIQKKYKDDREKMGQEMMKLYKENKVSPFGGCLPLLIQLPILFALFDVLHSVNKYFTYSQVKNVSFSFLGIGNVLATGSTMWRGGTINFFNPVTGKPAPIHYTGHEYLAVIVLILLSVITGYVSSKMMMTDPQQSKFMMIMPLMLGVFAWILPAGVTIYIIVVNVLTMAQQWVQLEREGFYEEKRDQRAKEGLPTGRKERVALGFKETTTRVLVALKIREAPPPAKKKATAKATKKIKPAAAAKPAAAKLVKEGDGQKPPAAKKAAGPPSKKPAASKDAKQKEAPSTGKSNGVKKAPSGKASGAKNASKGYPAKKSTKKK
jgi:YidC/Oxa1 family membrane protein insertase